jgi:hypothetical protein
MIIQTKSDIIHHKKNQRFNYLQYCISKKLIAKFSYRNWRSGLQTMHNQYTEFEVLTVKIMKNAVFWVVTLCNFERVQHFEETQQAAGCHPLLVCFLLGLFSGPKYCMIHCFKMSHPLQTTQCYNPEDCTLQPSYFTD